MTAYDWGHRNPSKPFTDYTCWRLKLGEGGQHTWHFLHTEEERKNWQQTDIDRYWLGLRLQDNQPLPSPHPPQTAQQAAVNGYAFLSHLQAPDGHFAGEYGGPMFLLPSLLIASYICGIEFEEEEKLEMIRYLFNRANEVDGGWGLHIEGRSTVLGTALNYVVLRIIGVEAEHPVMLKARGTLHALGSVLAIPSWGKFWLSALGVYEWEGCNPVPPELWLLPSWVPFHPSRWWVQARSVYLPVGYLYRARFRMAANEFTHALREELYTQPYHTIEFSAHRTNIAKFDLYTPHTLLLRIFNTILLLLQPIVLTFLPFLSEKAMARALQLINYEDENTSYQDIAPVSKAFHMVVHAHTSDKVALKKHEAKLRDFLWLGPDGMRCCGTNGSQMWDTAFAAQCLAQTGLASLVPRFRDSARKILQWIADAQMREDPKYCGVAYRQRTKGAWGFSTKEQGYMLTDCTGEGIKSVILLQEALGCQVVPRERLYDAVDLLLPMQNSDGGFSSYEPIRAPGWMEKINPSEVFGNIMTEINYPELTTSVITGLILFSRHCPEYRKVEIDEVVDRARVYLHKAQHPNGGWYGSWGICFTYGTMFALESLSMFGETYSTTKVVKRACDFLVSKQMADGGWGESYESCELESYIQHSQSQVVQTSWAALALMSAEYPDLSVLRRAVRMVMSRQLPDGSWAQEAIEGVFNKNCMISYPNFKLMFTVWMLGKAHLYFEERGDKV